MGMAEVIFKKGIYEITRTDLESFFSEEQEENAHLEFKDGRAELPDIHKEVAAFLNMEGGLLIIGAPTEKLHPSLKNTKICSGALTPCLKIGNQDTLMRSIGSNIFPAPIGIKCQPVLIPDGFVYVLDIPQSFNPPHQVTEKGVYYIRFERDAKPAPHGIVAALFNKRLRANLKGTIRVIPGVRLNKLKLLFELHNDSDVHADELTVDLEVHGIKFIHESKPLDDTIEIRDDLLRKHIDYKNRLVKGMTMSFEIECTLRCHFFHFIFSFYSKDSQLQLKQGVFDLQKNDFIAFEYNQEPDTTKGSIYPPIDIYERLLKLEVFRLLAGEAFRPNSFNSPASLDSIYELQHQMEVRLPDSYKVFLSTTNGFIGFIDGKRLDLYSVEQMMATANGENYDPGHFPIAIGKWDNYVISFNYHFEPEKLIEWQMKNSQGRVEKLYADSFFAVLDIFFLQGSDD